MIHSRTFFAFLFSTLFMNFVLSVKTCYFCADYARKCKQNSKSLEPTRMRCYNFMVDNTNPRLFVRNPIILNETLLPHMFLVSLPLQQVKTICVNVKFKLSKIFKNKSDVTNQTYSRAYFSFQSCMFEDYLKYHNACHYALTEIINPEFYEDRMCTLCDISDCNSDKTSLSNGPRMFLLFLLVVTTTREIFN